MITSLSMSNTIRSTKNLDTSEKEALGLLSSLGHAKDSTSPNGKLSAQQVWKLSEKINEILGDGVDRGPTQGNEPSQLLNEEGLPIIDISEPANEHSPSSSSPYLLPEPEFIPLSLLPPDEKERRRRERDRILDSLEEEERLQQLQEERDAEDERKEASRKRKESAKAELEQLKASRELQKKMGQALVRHTKGTEEDEEARLKAQVTSPVAKKCVSFANAPDVEADTREQQTSIRQPDWGDVTLGRLRAQDRIPLVSAAEAQKYPMKIHVVERHPTAPSASLFHGDADSDDESTSAGDVPPHTEDDSSDSEAKSLSSDNKLLDEPLEEEFDYDAAQHHREIALEYHQKRHAIGAETAKVMAAHDLDDYERHETWDGQPPLSRFRADRMAAAYDKSHGPVSMSIGQTVIPASRQKSLRNSVRLGRLEDDKLIVGECGESGSEDEVMREVIQMLKAGEIQNAGPDFKPSSMSTIAHQNSSTVEPTTVRTSSTTAHTIKPSKFKLARGGGVTERTTFQDNDSRDNVQPQRTVSNVIERKAATSLPGQRFPVNKPPLRSSVKAPEPASPLIIDSASFPLPASTSIVVPLSSPVQGSTIQSGMSSRDPSSAEIPMSRFMAERKK